MISFGGSAAAWDTPPFQALLCLPQAHPCLYATPAFSGTLHLDLHSVQPDTAGVHHWQLGALSVAVIWVALPLRLLFPLSWLFWHLVVSPAGLGTSQALYHFYRAAPQLHYSSPLLNNADL